jgi:biotin-(acetyl-CoA carboxylase) ligase
METTTEKREFEMYTKAGDRACNALVNKIIKLIDSDKKVTPDMIYNMTDKGREKIAEKHGEVYDTEPHYNIRNYVYKALEKNGYDADKFID